jgi:hypothetical protein
MRLSFWSFRKKRPHVAARLRRPRPYSLVLRVLINPLPRGTVAVAGDPVKHLRVLREFGAKSLARLRSP